MRIAMVSEHASPLAPLGGADAGGQNVHVAALSTQLARMGHDVTVWTRRDGPDLPPRVRRAGVTVEHVAAGPPEPIPKDELRRHLDTFTASLAHRWTRERPDVIHSHFWMSGEVALAARPPGCPVVHTFHALGVVKRRHLGASDPSPSARLAVERTIALTADRVVATCNDEVRELLALDADPARIDVVPCGVDVDRFTPNGPREATTRDRVVVLGRLVARKGVDDAILAMADVPGAQLVVAGGPPADRLDVDGEVRRLRDVARAAGVADRVSFRGAVDRAAAAALLRSADVVVCAPWYEPFGIVPLEAMACGVPVVASAVGGMLDSVVDGRTGLHVTPRDPAAIAQAVRRLLADPALRWRMGTSGRQRAVRRYNWPTVASRTLDSYRAVDLARSPELQATGPGVRS